METIQKTEMSRRYLEKVMRTHQRSEMCFRLLSRPECLTWILLQFKESFHSQIHDRDLIWLLSEHCPTIRVSSLLSTLNSAPDSYSSLLELSVVSKRAYLALVRGDLIVSFHLGTGYTRSIEFKQ